ncbi:MAG: hypothetical protein ACRDJC_11130, partial [Thermomicrobiales bacterium]
MTSRNPSHGDRHANLTRRQVAFGLAALGAAGVVTAPALSTSSVAASGQLPGASLVELATYTGWRRTWDLIVPLRAYRPYPRTLLLYDRAAGEATLIAVDESGGFREVRTFFGWRTTWDILVPSEFPETPDLTGLFAYDRAAGHVTTLQFDAFGNFQELRNYPNWRKTWTAFVPYGTDGLLAYERGTGYATLFNL